MITVSSNLKNAITGKGSQLIKITGSCYDTSNVLHSFTWTNADIVYGSFYVDKRCVSGSQFSFGNTVPAELGFELFGDYSDWLLEGVSVAVSLGGFVSGTATYFEVGRFILEKPSREFERTVFRGYDYLVKLDELADNWIMNTGSGENILGQAQKPSSTYPMTTDGYSNYIAGSASSPFYNSNPSSAATGMIPFTQNGRAPKLIVINPTGQTVNVSSSYFILFYYDNGAWNTVSGLTWPMNYAGYYTTTNPSTGRYDITFDVETGSNKTKFQTYLETNYGVHDYYIAFTLYSTSMASLTALSISYNSADSAIIKDTATNICEACGLEFLAPVPYQDNLDLSHRQLTDYSQYSYRTILGLLAQACGANLTVWPSGYGVFNNQIRFASPNNTGVTLDEADVMSAALADEAILINGARYVDPDGALYINRTVVSEPYKYFDFSGCPLFPVDEQDAVDSLADLTGSSHTWLPGKAKILAMPWLEPMDIVEFNYSVKPYYSGKFMITHVRITANGVTTIESAGFTETTNSNGYVASAYTPVEPFGLCFSSYAETITAGQTTNVPLSTFPKNAPTVNDYIKAVSGFGIVTAINGSFAEVQWLM